MSSRGFPVTQALRKLRREQAEKRQAEYDKLSLDEKLAKLPPAPQASKQRAKLLALKNKKAAPVVAQDATVAEDTKPKKLKAKDRRAAQKKDVVDSDE